MTLLELLQQEKGTYYLYYEEFGYNPIIGSDKLLLSTLNHSAYSRVVLAWRRNSLDGSIINVFM